MRRRTIWRKRALFAATAVATAATAGLQSSLPVSADAPTTSLEGEVLSGPTTAAPCNPLVPGPAPAGTYSFSTSGNASAPYSGTFTEEGTYTVAPGGNVTAFAVTFRIVSGTTVIEGSKELQAGSINPGFCRFDQATFPQINVTYTATITSPDGVATDAGTAFVAFQPASTGSLIFLESFTDSTGFVVVPDEPEPTAVELSPDTAVNPVGTAHTVTATVTDEDGALEGQTVTFTVTGASATSGSCTTGPVGSCEFTYTGPAQPGVDTIEGCVATGSEPLCDTVTKTWEALGPAVIDLTPDSAVNPVGTGHTVTATVTNSAGAGIQDETVTFTVTGASMTSGSCTTGSSGSCEFTYTGPTLPGADAIEGCVTAAAAPLCDTVTKAWELPATQPGQITGGGQVGGPAFGFNAKSDAKGVKGNCNVVDPEADLDIRCLDATAVVVTGAHATIFGTATVNGAAATYRIDADDLATPGRGGDTFRIQTSTGVSVGGVLTEGNVKIHQ